MKLDKEISKEINYSSIVVEGVDLKDYPDFVDAYVTYAEYTDGTVLTEQQMEELDSSVPQEIALFQAVGG